ncbi:hypothetical protein DV735_g3163, partial [Chaetothyriales sp. CBS 134920]
MTVKEVVRILIAGGAYAGLAAALNLLDLCNARQARGSRVPVTDTPTYVPVEISIVDERDGYFHLIGTPLAFASKEYAPAAWVKFEDIPALSHPAVRWIQGSLKRIDSKDKKAKILDSKSNEEYDLPYDYFLAATGLRRAWPAVPVSLNREDYVGETSAHVDTVQNASNHGGVVVVGGGAVGVEIAGELKYTHPSTKVTLIHSRGTLLSSEPLPDDCKLAALRALEDLGVAVILNQRVLQITDTKNVQGQTGKELTLQDGSKLIADHVMPAITKNVPATSYLPESVLDKEGMVKINSLLRFVDQGNDPYHLAAGDLVAWSGIKRCGRAQGMGARAAQNIYQHILSERHNIQSNYTEYQPISPVIALAVGNQAVVYDSKGTRCSEEQMKHFFGTDLGMQQFWDGQKLGESPNYKAQSL